MEPEKSRLRIEMINYHLLDGLILAAEKGSYSDLQVADTAHCEEYFAIHDLLVYVFRQILKEQDPLDHYGATSLRRGGFYYRRISTLIASPSLSITFPAKGCIQVDGGGKEIRYEQGRLKIFEKFDVSMPG